MMLPRAEWRLSVVLLLVFAGACCATALTAVAAVRWQTPLDGGTTVNLTNSGDGPLVDVVLFVSGQSYPVGTVPPGITVTVPIWPGRDSNLEIEYTAKNGRRRREDAGGYLGGGIKAVMDVDVGADKIRSSDIRYE